MSSIKREAIPVIPREFNPEAQQGMIVKSYWVYSCDEVSSAMQKAIRRGNSKEAIQWALGLLWSSVARATNVWTRIFTIAVEDVGLGNRMLIVQLNKIYNVYKEEKIDMMYKYTLVAYAVDLCAKSYKCRAADWLCLLKGDNITNLRAQIKSSTPSTVVTNLIDALQEPNYIKCAEQSIAIFEESNVEGKTAHKLALEKKPFDALFSEIPQVKWYKMPSGIREYIWVALKDVSMAINDEDTKEIIRACYNIGHMDNFRQELSGKLFWMHCILCLCIPDSNETFFDKTYPSDELYNMVEMFRSREDDIVGIPDYAIDMHTKKGANLKRGVEHFIAVGSHIENKHPEYEQLDKDVYKLAYPQRKAFSLGSRFSSK